MPTACHALIEEFVDLLDTPAPFARFRAGFGLVFNVWKRRAQMHEDDGLDVSGFHPKLIANGQNGEALRHLRLHSGCILLGPFGWPMSIGMDLIDQLQARSGRPESITECRDNIAGRETGHHLISAFAGEISRDVLRQLLYAELGDPS